MPTKLNVAKFSNFFNKNKYSFENAFYFKENSEEVLRKVFLEYPVQEFNKLKISQENILRQIETKDKKIFNKLYLGGLCIGETNLFPKEFNDLENFSKDKDFGLIKRTKSPNINSIMFSLVNEYLIEKRISKKGKEIQGCGRKIIYSEPSIQEGISYLEMRKEKEILEKEEILEDILKYGKAIFGKNFEIGDLEIIAREILKEFPKKVKPLNINFANLSPSNYIENTMFPKGPKFRE